jgi:peptide/nickel transport system substrate-binding protein
LTLVTRNYDFVIPVLEVVQQQLIEVGVDFKIQAMDPSLVDTELSKGEFDLAVTGYNYPTADVLYFFYHSSMLGALNWNMVADPELDVMLDASRTTMEPQAQQSISDDIQKYIVENAYVVPLLNEIGYSGISTQVEGYVWSDVLKRFDFSNAYLVSDPPQ